jgi:hypothetical protein
VAAEAAAALDKPADPDPQEAGGVSR